MKKFLSLALILAMVLTMLAACGGQPAETAENKPTGTQSAAPAGETKTWEELGLKHPLQDVRVRQALSMAIDKDTIIASLFQGKAEKAISMTSPGEWLADGLEAYDYDPEGAKALLEEAGWPADYTLDVVYYYADQQTVDLMTVIGQYWSEVGVKAQFRKLEGDLNTQLWIPPADKVNGPSEVKWDMAYAAVAALTENEFYERFMSTASNNSTLPKQEGLDELIMAMGSTTDTQEQIAAAKEVQKAMNEGMFQLPLYHQVVFIFTSDKLDMKGNVPGNDQYSYEKNILDWTIDREDKTLYTNSGPMEFFEAPLTNPGLYAYEDLVFDRLINADPALNPTDGLLAKSYSYNDTMDVLTLELRDDVIWHDGEPFTAEDVKFTLELYLKSPTASTNITTPLKMIKGAQDFIDGKADEVTGIKIDGNTVTLELDGISPNLLIALAQWPILPSHLLSLDDAATLQQNSYWQKPIGTGPFKVSEVKMGNYATLERFDGYFRQGEGNIEKVYMFASGENDANLIKNVEAGKIDYAWSKSTDDAVAVEKVDGMTVTDAKIRYTRLFYINQFPHEANIK